MPSDRQPVDQDHADPEPVGSLQLDDAQLPIYDLGDFNAADVRRVASFVTNFGSWKLPFEVATALASGDGLGALEWIHDTGELVLLGGTPTEGQSSAEVDGLGAFGAGVPGFLGGTTTVAEDASGQVREYFRSEVMPPGSRVALLAHIANGPRAHELLWGWHRERRNDGAWDWLVERLARLEDDPDEASHLG